MIKTNIKMRVTPEQSKKVQEICFKNGIFWNISTKKDVLDVRGSFLYIENTITHDIPCKNDINDIKEMEDFFKKNDLLEINPDLFIRTNGTCIEEEFTYPMWFKSKASGNIIEFTGLRTGKAIYLNPLNIDYFKPLIGIVTSGWTPHTDTSNWEQVENPNEHLDRLDDIVDEVIKEVSKQDSHNAHYKAQKIDTIARCKANMTLEQQKAICIFNIDRYLHREKGQNLSDIKKIKDYTNWLEEIENSLSNS